jgi:diadenosine tetraphosphate (Ap4A) HIT family hydrolase
MSGCLACELTATNGAPGGCIHESAHWYVDHTVGALGVGTLIARPKRHVLHVAELEPDEAAELGPLLQQATAVVTELAGPDQVYVTLWSHAGGRPGHIHFVVQPVTRAQVAEHGLHGPALQLAMFDRGEAPDPGAAAAFAERARAAWPS